MQPPLLFTYGTLKRGFPNHDIMEKAGGVCLGIYETEDPYPLVFKEFPYILDRPGEGFRVVGELFAIGDDAGWKILDDLEDHPNEYERRPRKIARLNGDDPVLAWIYFANQIEGALLDLEPMPEFLDQGIDGR